MKSKFMIMLKLSLTCILFFTILQTSSTNVHAESLESNDIEVETMASVAEAKIWFKGVVVGALSLGTFIYITGKPPEEWVLWGLKGIEKKIKDFSNSNSYVPGKPIYVASNGNISACVVYPCAIGFSIIPNELTEDNTSIHLK